MKQCIDNNKPVKKYIKLYLCFYKEELKPDTWGSADVAYEIYYWYDEGIMTVEKIDSFGDRTLVKQFRDKRNRGITEDEMLENIKELSNMTYKEFKEKVLQKD